MRADGLGGGRFLRRALRTFVVAGLLALAQAAPAFQLQRFNGGGERLLFVPQGLAFPAGWTDADFNDAAWGAPQLFQSAWLADALRRPWSSYQADGKSLKQDDLLLRLHLALPAGLTRARGELELVVDDNVRVWLNGRRIFADPDGAFLGEQPRTLRLPEGWRACDNLLALQVHSMNPTGIGYKFRLTVEGEATPGQDCGSAGSPGRQPTPRPTLQPTPQPTPQPTQRPTPRLKARRSGGPAFVGPASTPTPGLSPTAACPPSPTPGAGSWQAPSRPRVLAQRRDFQLRAHRDQLVLAFHLSATARVWAEAEGVQGLPPQSDGAAPEAFLDDDYLGPLLAEPGGAWRSPQARWLGPGPHRLLLRSSSLAAGAPAAGRRFMAVSDAAPVFVPAPTPPPCRCEEGPYSRAWPARLHGKALVLSVLSGRAQSAGLMAQLPDGGAWECRVRLPAPAGKPLPVLLRLKPLRPGRVELCLGLDQDYHGQAEALGYRPGEWTPLRLRWCRQRLLLRLGHGPELVSALPPGPLGLELSAQDLEVGLSPAR